MDLYFKDCLVNSFNRYNIPELMMVSLPLILRQKLLISVM